MEGWRDMEEEEVVVEVEEEEEEEGGGLWSEEIWVPDRDPAAWMGFMSFPRQRPSTRAASSSEPAVGELYIR